MAHGDVPACTLLIVPSMPRQAMYVVLLAAACVDEPLDDATHESRLESAVVGGTTAQSGEWPDAVAVLGTSGTCTGTLIAPNLVLTAGHCANINPQQIIANTIDYSQDAGTRIHVAKTTAYPSWQTSYDAALLELASTIDNIAPRRVGTRCTFDTFTRDTPVRLVGFGATDTAGQTANTQLKQAMTSVTDPDCSGGKGCKQAVAPGGEFVAGGTGEADSCFGDSGGPVYLDTPDGAVVVGAVSRGVDGSATPCGGGGIYVRTDKLVGWIESTANTTLDTDSCETAYRANAPDEPGDAGCAATGGSGVGAIGLVLLTIRKRRRCSRAG